MSRHRLRDATWASLHAKLVTIPGIWKADVAALRRFVEAVAYVLRTGTAWEDLPAAFGEPVQLEDTAVPVRASIGTTLFTAGQDRQDVLHRADTAMYEAKRESSGRELLADLTP